MIAKDLVIIGGTFKSGTSALFTYLSQVEGICPSSVKETGFFVPARYGEHTASLEHYLHYFAAARESDNIFLEASPGYLSGGTQVAEYIRTFTGQDAKMIFLLRDPVERLISFYKMIRENNDVYMSKEVAESNMSLRTYLDACIAYEGNTDYSLESRDFLFNGLSDGDYAALLEQWFSVYPPDKIRVIFFEDLIADPKRVCTEVLTWLDLDPSGLDHIVFRPVNQFHQARSKSLRKFAYKINARFQHFFRRNERLKRRLVGIYHFLNARQSKQKDPQMEERLFLAEHYRASNLKLRDLLAQHGHTEFPDWVTRRD